MDESHVTSDTPPTISNELLEFVRALARDTARRDLKNEQEQTRRRIAEELDPKPTVAVPVTPKSKGARFREADLTRALKASLKAGITPQRVELLADGRILLHYTQPPSARDTTWDDLEGPNPWDEVIPKKQGR